MTTEQEAEAAAALVSDALGGCDRVEPFRGRGRNNRGYVAWRGEERYFCKRYFREPGEAISQRQESEWRFLRLALAQAPERVAEPLAKDEATALSVFRFVEGAPFAGAIGPTPALDAARFVRAVNEPRLRRSALPPASDACFSIRQHFEHVGRRLEALDRIGYEGLARLVAERLRPAFEAAVAATRELGLEEEVAIEQEERWASPSDFGFHNALRRGDGTIVYLDFEYAGWDDPVKCVCDFYCQPDCPVDLGSAGAFLAELRLGEGRPYRALVERLLPLYVVKWTCILLNPFREAVARRRAFASAAAGSLEATLEGARHYFENHPVQEKRLWHM